MNKDVYKHLLETYGRNPGQWFGFTAEIIRTLLHRILMPFIMAQTAALVAMGDIDGAKRYALYFATVYIAGSVIGVVGELVAIYSENTQYSKLLMTFYAKLTSKDMDFYRDNQTGYLASAFRQYLDGSMLMVRFLRSDVIRTFISLTTPAIVLMFIEWRIGLVTVGIVLLQILYVMWSSAKATEYRLLTQEIYRKLTGEVSDEITNIVAFKSGGIEKEAHAKVSKLADEEIRAFWLRRKTTTLLDLPRSIITALGVTAGLFVVLNRADGSPASVALVVLSLNYMFQTVRNVSELPGIILHHDDHITKIFPTLKYLDRTYEDIRDPENPVPLKISKAAISIEKVSFSYDSKAKERDKITVFENLNIEVAGGEQVGIVGLSGAGKSTLASLLMRFDDVEQGVIKIDGIDIKNVSQSELHRKIAYVPQEPLLFHRSVKENIAYFNQTASDADIKRAAKAAHAHGFISKLPQGYDTIVGERGVKLSGGQKQRVVIARAILKNAPIMIFDEATSALDSESEQIIQQALPEILGKHTAIIIAHRLSTVAGLDRIIVIHDGVIEEQGTHKQLLKNKKRYYSLWQKQTNGNESDV